MDDGRHYIHARVPHSGQFNIVFIYEYLKVEAKLNVYVRVPQSGSQTTFTYEYLTVDSPT